MLVIYLAPLPRGFLFGLGTLVRFRCRFRNLRIPAYRWCSPPRIGYATTSPNLSIGPVQGVSFPSETRVRTSL